MSIGQITLDPIKVNVSTSLLGLQGLKGLTTIDSVDVMGGTAQGINLDINGTQSCPSLAVVRLNIIYSDCLQSLEPQTGCRRSEYVLALTAIIYETFFDAFTRRSATVARWHCRWDGTITSTNPKHGQ